MNEKITKKLLAAALISSVIVSSGSMTVFAKSSASDIMGDASFSGQVSMDSTSVTAETVCPRSATVFAEARVDYWYGTAHYFSTACDGTTGGTAAATVSIKKDGAEVTGGKGRHYVSFDTLTWKTETQTGEVYVDAKHL